MSAIIKEERIGGQRLILGDCLQVMPLLGRFDAVVTDPPYGIDYGRSGGFNASHGWGKWRENVSWDKDRPSPDFFAAMLDCSKEQIIWGGNYFADLLPPTMRWLAWDKAQRGFSLADFEMAWTSQHKAARIFEYGRGNESGFAPKSKEERWATSAHPTQKPVALMEWCLGFLPDARTILDPFMGSGTTLVACQRLGRSGTGIELDPEYFAIACRRVDEATRQPDLFVQPAAPKPTQDTMDI